MLRTWASQDRMADGIVDRLEGAFGAELRKKLNLTVEQAIRAQQMGINQADFLDTDFEEGE